MKTLTSSLLVGPLLALAAGIAQATLIDDSIDFEMQLSGNIELRRDGTQLLDLDNRLVDGGTVANFCIIAAGSSQDCSLSGITGAVSVGAESITFALFGSTGTGGSIDWWLTDLDWVGMSGRIIDVLPASQAGVEVDDFGDHYVHFSTDSTNFVGVGSFTFDLVTEHVPEPGSMALLGIGLLGAGAARGRRKG